MSTRAYCSLAIAAMLVGWYQLPVLTERSQALHFPGQELLTYALESATATVGTPVVALRDWGETSKLHLQASLLAWATPAVIAATPPARVTAAAVTSTVTATFSGSKPAPTAASPQIVDSHAGQPVEAPAVLTRQSVVAVLAGDSVMGELAYGLKRWSAKEKTWTIVDAHKVSSGLSNQGYYDWPATFHSLMQAHQPKVVLMMVGANDAQDIYENRKRHAFGSESWRELYGQRATKILTDAVSGCTTTYWVLPPIVKDPGFEKRMSIVREIIREKVQNAGNTVHLIDANAVFTDENGKYTASKKIQGKVRTLRTDDGVHLTYAGAQVFVDAILNHAEQYTPPACSKSVPK